MTVDLLEDNIFKIKENGELNYLKKFLDKEEQLCPYPANTRIQEHNWWVERMKRLIWTARSDLTTLKIVEAAEDESK